MEASEDGRLTEKRRRSLRDRVIAGTVGLTYRVSGRPRLAFARRRRGKFVAGRVSIPIATFDRIDILLERTIPALLGQTHTDVEVIVVGDGTPEELFARLSTIADPRLRLHRLTERTSYPTSALERWMVAGWRPRNFGAKLATGEWIVWISDDDEFLVNGVELLLKAARTDPSAEIVTAAYQSGSIGPRIFRPADGVRDVGFPFGGTGWMMRAHLVGFRWNGHSWRKARDRPCDYDLVVRLRDAGARFLAVDHVVVIQHEVAGTGMIGRRGALAAAGEDPDAE
jgi:O-antigen biosynthesis protein